MRAFWLACVCTLSLLGGCTAYDVERTMLTPDSLRTLNDAGIRQLEVSSPYVKAHLKSGNLFRFDAWTIHTESSTITGHAILFNASRDTLSQGTYSLGFDSIAILETNVVRNSGSAVAITVFMGITAAVAVNCIANPKSCFGSCPTFYADDGDGPRLQAEGFSSSIAPALEAADIDALFHAQARDGEIAVIMKNEAFETHVVRHVDLLALQHREGSRTFVTPDGQFWESPSQLTPRSATAPEGDCLSSLAAADGNERYSLADADYLGAKEEVTLNFLVEPGKPYGLVLGCRQTLLPTYLLYQTFAYMGSDAARWIAQLGQQEIREPDRMAGLIGGIEIFVPGRGGEPVFAGLLNEHGPLAVDMHLMQLPAFTDTAATIQLRMTKGTWRIDYAGLAELSRRVEPARVQPAIVLKGGVEDEHARGALTDSARVLISLPGDEYTLRYRLPHSGGPYEYFIESRGYYLEWIRQEWIREENPLFLSQMFLDPEGALRRMTPEFKKVEPDMEECFWRSRYARP